MRLIRADQFGADHEAVATAATALADGAVVAVPTDTVYGLAVDPTQPAAVELLFALKERPVDVPLPLLVAGWEQIDVVAAPFDVAAERLARRFWPGPLTLVVPRRSGFTVDLGGPAASRQTVGLRWPDHPLIQALCHTLGPLAVTSANLHGQAPATSASEVEGFFAGSGDLAVIVDGGPCQGTPSTVVECRGPASRCLREGAILWSDVMDPNRS